MIGSHGGGVSVVDLHFIRLCKLFFKFSMHFTTKHFMLLYFRNLLHRRMLLLAKIGRDLGSGALPDIDRFC